MICQDWPAESQTKIAPIVSTERSAAVILKYWDRKYHRTADLVVIEGPKAGGHLGFSREQLEEYAEYDDKEYAEKSYDDEVKKIMAVVRNMVRNTAVQFRSYWPAAFMTEQRQSMLLALEWMAFRLQRVL